MWIVGRKGGLISEVIKTTEITELQNEPRLQVKITAMKGLHYCFHSIKWPKSLKLREKFQI